MRFVINRPLNSDIETPYVGTAPKPLTLAIARLLAEGHANAGFAQFNELQRVYYEDKQHGRPGQFTERVPYAVSAATSLALALELTLKVVHFQSFGKYARTHDVLAIARGLPEERRVSMDEFYKQMFVRPEPLDVVHFSVGLDIEGIPRPPHQIPDVSLLQLALEHVRDAFVTWRYVYERLETPKPVHIHFKALLCLIEAAKNELAQFRGDSRVTLG